MIALEAAVRRLASRIAATCACLRVRLADVRGDTIAEALVALLIAAMGAAALATMVMAAMNAAVSTQEMRDNVYQAESTMVSSEKTVATISVAAGEGVGMQECDVKVTLYASPDGTFVRYVDDAVEAQEVAS